MVGVNKGCENYHYFWRLASDPLMLSINLAGRVKMPMRQRYTYSAATGDGS
jgi:hypothetical protein